MVWVEPVLREEKYTDLHQIFVAHFPDEKDW